MPGNTGSYVLQNNTYNAAGHTDQQVTNNGADHQLLGRCGGAGGVADDRPVRVNRTVNFHVSTRSTGC